MADVATTPITYCFVVTNTGETYLNTITISDTTLNVTDQQMTFLSGTQPLEPGKSLVYYLETTLTAPLVNTANTEGNPSNKDGTDLPGYSNPKDSDDAQVEMDPRALEETDEPTQQKRLFLPLITR